MLKMFIKDLFAGDYVRIGTWWTCETKMYSTKTNDLEMI